MTALPKTRVCLSCQKRKSLDDDHFYRSGQGQYLGHTCKACIIEQAGERNRESGHNVTPREARHRKPIAITLSEKALAKLDRLAAKHGGNRSKTVENLIEEA